MIKKFQKVAFLFQLRIKYPDVVYFGAPSVVKFFGMLNRTLRKGFYSQSGQDELVFTQFFKALNSSVFPKLFVDIGCNHPTLHSNSYFFEVNQGYKVLAVDALKEVHEWWRSQRPAAEFIECAVGARNGELRFDVVSGGENGSMFSSVSGSSQKGAEHSVTTRTVNVRRIADIFEERGIQRAGILSMDIEGYELPALQGINFTQFMAYVFIIENNSHQGLGCNQIRDLMISNGYIYYARIWNLDDIFIHPVLLALCQGVNDG
jgi:FkbM family methyltransferase